MVLRHRVAAAVLPVAVLLLAGCSFAGSSGTTGDDPAPGATAAPARPPSGFPVGARVDYQLGGAYPPADGVGAVVRDSTATAAPGLFSVCYVNAFQTQPQDRDAWLNDHPGLVLRHADGSPVFDPGWPDEMVLDTSTPAKRDGIAAVLAASVARCAGAGFTAVELDNLDSYLRSDGALTPDDDVAMAQRFVALGHERHLLVGQKNAAELAGRGRAAGFDFAVTEECLAFAECDAYRAVYGDATLDVEYTGAPCDDPARPRSTVLRDRQLVRPGEPGYLIDVCPPGTG